MESDKPILLSGIKPTGTPHIGNYFGALRQFVEFQTIGTHQCYFMIADYHALNSVQNAGQMRELTKELVLTFLAIGLNSDKVVIFKQSDVPAHTELAWIFDTITTMPYLMRAHAFKDAEAKKHEISVGTFNYPMLMAADILLYDAARVPVGQDQKQHIEYARDAAEKFNRIFGDTFTLPEEYIVPDVAVVPGIDGQKMSKSYQNTIPLFASRSEIEELVMSIVTDSSGDRPENVYQIHRLLKSEHDLAPLYEEHKGKYKALKEALIEDLDAFIAPLRERYAELAANPSIVSETLEKGAESARARASQKIEEVRRAVGVS
ncbi:tryptophan--tRNA ligase [Patescibacteria group bacterium]|nr:tryptophan--tRNA ligase [Patescibacteria group bacterium]MBU1500938.1 tryptophan--tRNA ligase [Patescibacteria group bacterium]MBU2080569.1 tryptophan--tRNA ligase [Patescibacteria group bacterium]MBU2124355.1 tryptophan--tRNA ligase [Patescibacteria group bacterium]MBU2194482.1 tryptophan--tRNA ligase [Patescibacteria group bacterium]